MNPIPIDSDLGKRIGFTSDRFDPRSIIVRSGRVIQIQIVGVTTARPGYFSDLLRLIGEQGISCQVWSPNDVIRAIVQRREFSREVIPSPIPGDQSNSGFLPSAEGSEGSRVVVGL